MINVNVSPISGLARDLKLDALVPRVINRTLFLRLRRREPFPRLSALGVGVGATSSTEISESTAETPSSEESNPAGVGLVG